VLFKVKRHQGIGHM